MRVTTGKVVEGKIVVEGEPFEEGITVTILAPESDEAVQLSPEEEADLLEAMAEADAGDFVDGEEVLRELRGQR
ncbi:MAG TPA: hypothetical protein VGG03_02390 [Thermoanaerobaculia bacterium]|jgi:hypothetical protein